MGFREEALKKQDLQDPLTSLRKMSSLSKTKKAMSLIVTVEKAEVDPWPLLVPLLLQHCTPPPPPFPCFTASLIQILVLFCNPKLSNVVGNVNKLDKIFQLLHLFGLIHIKVTHFHFTF